MAFLVSHSNVTSNYVLNTGVELLRILLRKGSRIYLETYVATDFFVVLVPADKFSNSTLKYTTTITLPVFFNPSFTVISEKLYTLHELTVVENHR
jgi:hypothetical protein